MQASRATAQGLGSEICRALFTVRVGCCCGMQASRATAQGLQVGLAIGLVAAVALWFGAPTLVGAMAGEARGNVSSASEGTPCQRVCSGNNKTLFRYSRTHVQRDIPETFDMSSSLPHGPAACVWPCNAGLLMR